MSKRWIRWALFALFVVLLAAGVLRALGARKAQQQAVAAAATSKAQTAVELAASDVVRARVHELSQGLPISGTLKAVDSAVIKARVAGELRGLAVREGDAVQAGQVVARVDPTEFQSRLAQVQQQADAAKAQIDIAQRQWDNNKALVDQGFISRTALDTSLNNLAAAQATHKAALAAVEVARKSLDDTVLRAPIRGQVALRAAQNGERVGVDAKVLEIVDLSRIELEASLAAADAVDVRVGQTAQLQIEGSTRTLAARVVRINPSAQPGSRSVLVYLSIEQPAGLRHGMFAQGTLGTAQLSALALPLSAVRVDKPAPYVQLVEDGRVVHRPVEPGARGQSAGETVVALRGLAEGALVIAGAVGSLREGTAVRFTQPAAGGASASGAAAAATSAPTVARPAVRSAP